MERIYVSANRETRCWSPSFIVLVVFCFVGFVLISLYMRGAYNEAREDLIERLQKGKEVAEINNNLKMEHSAITRGRFLELQAKRLGLKKAKEEEVLVLR